MESHVYPNTSGLIAAPSIGDVITAQTKHLPRNQTILEDSIEIQKLQENRPVVYIDVPEHVAENRVPCTVTLDTDAEEDIQYTIFYDPFGDRRIKTAQKNVTVESQEDHTGFSGLGTGYATGSPGSGPSRPAPPAPEGFSRKPPNTLNFELNGIQSGSSPDQPPQGNHIFGQSDDGFYLSPLSLGYPAPPPAYSEAVSDCTSLRLPPRNEDIFHMASQADLSNPHRKYLFCYRCTKQVHTVTAWSSGWFTYIIGALFLLCCLLPCVAMACMMKLFKQRDHYCPNCNEKISYEVPILCNKMLFVSKNT